MAESDDEVVSEVDVYLSKKLAKNLYLFQYPVRPSTKTYDDETCLRARVKPKQQKLEMEFQLREDSHNYDRGKGEQIALNVDGQNSSGTGDSCFNGNMDKHYLTSTKAVPLNSRYAVGLLRPGELHLTPLHALVQLRPSFLYLDKVDAHVHKTDAQVASETEDGEEEEVQAVHSRFARPETERGKQARERSYNYFQQQMASESWQMAVYHPFKQHMSSVESANLYCDKMDHDASDLPGTVRDYIHSLLPASLSIASGIGEGGSKSITTKLQGLPLPDQIKAILMNSKIVRFCDLMELLPPDTDGSAVLRSLQQFATLVQGCWVLKSDILYNKGTDTAPTSKGANQPTVSAEMLCQARDYILWHFTQNRVLQRSDLISALKLSADEVTNLLNDLGRYEPSVGWHFRYFADEEFLLQHPDLVRKHQAVWDVRNANIAKTLRQNATKDNTLPRTPKPRQRRRSHRESMSDSAEESNTDDSALFKKSPQRVKAESPTKKASKTLPLSHVTPPEVSPTWQEFTPSPEMKRELNQFVNTELKSRHCLTLTEAKRLLMMKLAGSPPGHILSRGVGDKLLEETMMDLGAQLIQVKWPQNTPPEPLYAFLRLLDHHDKFREALIDLFTRTARIRVSTFRKKVEDELGETMGESVCQKLLQDYCLFKSGYYYLKGTISSDS